MARTPQDIFTEHAAALATGDAAEVVKGYSEDAVLLTIDGALQGHAAIQRFFSAALAALPEAEFALGASVFSGDALLVRWSASSPRGRVTDAVDTFVFADGRIRLQTTVFTLEPPAPA